MSLDSQAFENLPHVEATLNYLTPMAEKPVYYTYEPPPGVSPENGVYEAHALPIRDARPIADDLSLDQQPHKRAITACNCTTTFLREPLANKC